MSTVRCDPIWFPSQLREFCAPGAERHTVGILVKKYVPAGTTKRNCGVVRPAEGLENDTAVLHFDVAHGMPPPA